VHRELRPRPRGRPRAPSAELLGAALRAELDRAIERGVAFLLAAQHANGAWAGFWGVNYTYGTFFAVPALLAAGLSPHHPAIVRATQWLLAAQRPDGGWGESFEGVIHDREAGLPADEPSSATQTAWALLTLLATRPDDARSTAAIERGLGFLLARQGPDGAWPEERATGVFFNTAVLDYRLYRQIFPAWALARFLKLRGGPATTISSTSLAVVAAYGACPVIK
jgi:squalene cyclase